MQIFTLTKKPKKSKKQLQAPQKSLQSQVKDAQKQGPPPQHLTNYMFHNLFNQRCIRRYIFQFIQSKRKRESCYSARISDGSFRVKVIVMREIASYIQKKLIKPFSIIDGALEYCGDGIVFLKIIFRHYDFAFAIGNTIPWKYQRFNFNQNGWNKIDWQKSNNYDAIQEQEMKKLGKCNRSQQTASLQVKNAQNCQQNNQLPQKQRKQQMPLLQDNKKSADQKQKNDYKQGPQNSLARIETQTMSIIGKEIKGSTSFIKEKMQISQKEQKIIQIIKISSKKLLLNSQEDQIKSQKQQYQVKVQESCDDDIDQLLQELMNQDLFGIKKQSNSIKKLTQSKIAAQTRQQKIQEILDFLEESQFQQTRSEDQNKFKTSFKKEQQSKANTSQKLLASNFKGNRKELQDKPYLQQSNFSQNKILNFKQVSNIIIQNQNNLNLDKTFNAFQSKKAKNDAINQNFEKFEKIEKKNLNFQDFFDFQDLFQQANPSQTQNLNMNKDKIQNISNNLVNLENLIHSTSSVTQKSWFELQLFLISDQLSDEKINKTDRASLKFRKGFFCNQQRSIMVGCRILNTIELIQSAIYYIRKIIVKQISPENVKNPFIPMVFFILQDSQIILREKTFQQCYQKKDNWISPIQKIITQKQEGDFINFIGIVKSFKIIKLNQKPAKEQNSNTSCVSNSKMVNIEIVDPFTGHAISFIDFSNKFSFEDYDIKYFPVTVLQAKVSIYKNKKGTKSHFTTICKINFIPNISQRLKWQQFLGQNLNNMQNLIQNLQTELQNYKQLQCVDDICFAQQNSKGTIYCQIINIKKMKYLGCVTCLKKVVDGLCKSCGVRKNQDTKFNEFVTGVFADHSGSIKFTLSNQCIANIKNKIIKQMQQFNKQNKLEIQKETGNIEYQNKNSKNQEFNDENLFDNLMLQYAEIWFTKSQAKKPIVVDRIILNKNKIKMKINKVKQSLSN